MSSDASHQSEFFKIRGSKKKKPHYLITHNRILNNFGKDINRIDKRTASKDQKPINKSNFLKSMSYDYNYVYSCREILDKWNENGPCTVRFVSVLTSLAIINNEMFLKLKNFDENETVSDTYVAKLPLGSVYYNDFVDHLRSKYQIAIPKGENIKKWHVNRLYLEKLIFMDILGVLGSATSYIAVNIQGAPLIRNTYGNNQKLNVTIKNLWENLIKKDSDPDDIFTFEKVTLLEQAEKDFLQNLRAPQETHKIFKIEDINVNDIFSSDVDNISDDQSEESLKSQFSDSDFEDFLDASDGLPKKRILERPPKDIKEPLDDAKKRKLETHLIEEKLFQSTEKHAQISDLTEIEDHFQQEKLDDDLLEIQKPDNSSSQNYGSMVVDLVSIATQTVLTSTHIDAFLADKKSAPTNQNSTIKSGSRYACSITERPLPKSEPIFTQTQSEAFLQPSQFGTSTQNSTDFLPLNNSSTGYNQDDLSILFSRIKEKHNNYSTPEKSTANHSLLSKDNGSNIITSLGELNKILLNSEQFLNTNLILKGKVVGMLPTQQMILEHQDSDELNRITFSFCLSDDFSNTSSYYTESNSVFVHCTNVPWLYRVLKLESYSELKDTLNEIYLKSPIGDDIEVQVEVAIKKKKGGSNIFELHLVPFENDEKTIFKKINSNGSTVSKINSRPPLRPEQTMELKSIRATESKQFISVVALMVSIEYVEKWNKYAVYFTDFTYNNDAKLQFEHKPYLIDYTKNVENGEIFRVYCYPEKIQTLKSRFEACNLNFTFDEFLKSENVTKYGIFCRFDVSVKMYNRKLDGLCNSIWPLNNENILPDSEKPFLYSVRQKFYSRISNDDIKENLKYMSQFTPLKWNSKKSKYTFFNGSTDDEDQEFDEEAFEQKQFNLQILENMFSKEPIPYDADMDLSCMKFREENDITILKRINEETRDIIYKFSGTVVSYEPSNNFNSICFRIGEPLLRDSNSSNKSQQIIQQYNLENTLEIHILFPTNVMNFFENDKIETYLAILNGLVGKKIQFQLRRIAINTTPTNQQILWVPVHFLPFLSNASNEC